MIGSVVGAALWAVVAGLLLALVVCAAVALTTRWLKPAAGTRHAWWFVALLVCGLAPALILAAMSVRGALAPPLPTSSAAAVAGHARAVPSRNDDRAAQRVRAALEPLGTVPFVTASAAPLPSGVARWILATWLTGTLIGLIGLGRSVARVRGLKRRSSPLDGSLADELPWLTEGGRREIYVRLSYEIETPIAVGFRRPVVLIPTELATADGLSAIEPLIVHEHAHLEHYDDWTNLLQRALERIWWFNPLVWLVGRCVALEREVSADEAVVARAHDAADYASTLWRMAREMRMPEHVVVAPGALLTRKQIAIRIDRLVNGAAAPPRLTGIGLALASLAATMVAAVAATAPALDLPPAASAAASSAPVAVSAGRSPVAVHASASAAPHPAAAHLAKVPLPRSLPQVVVAPRVAPPAPAAPLPLVAQVPRPAATPAVSRALVASCANGCDLSKRDLRGLDLHGLTLRNADLSGADLRGADLSGSALTAVELRRADLTGANLTGARLLGSNLRGATLTDATLTGMQATGLDLRGATVRGAIDVRSLLDGCRGCDFSHLDLHGLDLHGVVLTGDDLTDADLHGATLHGARLTGVDLGGANLDHADCSDVRFVGIDLAQASMNGTTTTGATFLGTSLP